jgi:hypothetical protein
MSGRDSSISLWARCCLHLVYGPCKCQTLRWNCGTDPDLYWPVGPDKSGASRCQSFPTSPLTLWLKQLSLRTGNFQHQYYLQIKCLSLFSNVDIKLRYTETMVSMGAIPETSLIHKVFSSRKAAYSR